MSKYIGFRCPDVVAKEIDNHVADTGKSKTEVILAMVQGLPSLSVNDRRTFPDVESIYLVWADNSLLYIGQTKNLRKRFEHHHRLVEFLNCEAKVAWFDASGCNRLDVEGQLIELFLPTLNWAADRLCEYLIIESDPAKPLSSQLLDCNEDNSLGTIVARSQSLAITKALELTSASRPIAIAYFSLNPEQLSLAKSLPIFWVQPDGINTDERPNPPCPDCGRLGRQNGCQPNGKLRYRCINSDCSRSGYLESCEVRGRKKQVLTGEELEDQKARKRRYELEKQKRYRAKKKLAKEQNIE
jgi:hypothetical protein